MSIRKNPTVCPWFFECHVSCLTLGKILSDAPIFLFFFNDWHELFSAEVVQGQAAVQTQHLPGPFSRKMTLDSGKKLEPVMTISSPPLTRQLVRLVLSTWGSS